MVERVIYALIYLCGLAAVFYLIPWVLAKIGIAIPAMIITIFGVILVLVAILILWRLFAGSSFRLWPGA